MPNSARILRFPARRSVALTSDEASFRARDYLDTARAERSSELLQELSNPDVVGAICRELRSVWNDSPSTVAEEATELFESIKSAPSFGGLFDEKDYFLGEAALLAAGAHRLLGNRELTERWLDRADTSFRHTVNPTPLAAEVAYLRLALRYDMGRHDDVLELAPSLIRSFEKLGMHREAAKAGLLHAVALKVTGQTSEALVLLEQIREKSALIADSHLQGRLLVDIGDAHQIEGRVSEALAAYREALTLLQTGNTSSSLAELKLVVGALFRGQGHLDQSLESLQSSVRDFEAMSMSTRSAYVRVLIADTLIAMSRPREAEWEILAALPTIEKQKMVPEGFAAVALLKESVRRRKTDPNALRELREHLQASK